MAETDPTKRPLPSERKIFIFEDDEEVVQLMKTCLEVEGFQVRTSRDGRDILKKAIEFKPDAIVTDLMMPGGGGYEVLRALQGDDLTRKVPVFIMTGYMLDDSTKKMMELEPNMAGYFQKPVRPERLATAIHKALNTLTRHEQQELERSKKNDDPSIDDLSKRWM